MKVFGVLCLIAFVGFSSAFPKSRYYPRAYMVGGSFYSNPRYAREGPGYEYIPPGQMTAMVLGDTVATNSFSGPGFNPPHRVLSVPNSEVGQVEEQQVSEQVSEKYQPILIPVPEPDSINETEPQQEEKDQPAPNLPSEQETLFSFEEDATESAVVSTTKVVPVIVPSKVPVTGKKVKTGRAKKPATVAPQSAEEDEEEEEGDSGLPASWPFGGAGRGGIPNYNAFFPIFIGGGGRSRTRSTESQEGGYPGSATAIANSFSTGKGGVATSHATSFGDPLAAAMFRNAGLYNFRTKSTKKHHVLEEEE